MSNQNQINGYKFSDSKHGHHHSYLIPTLEKELSRFNNNHRIMDLGCGNGSMAAWLHNKGWDITGVDPSKQGIEQAKKAWPQLKFYMGSCYDDLAQKHGKFPAVISLEVVEHVYAPREYARCLFNLLEPGGRAIISTPYHGYFKNLALAVTGKMDSHFTALWDHGHIKFWSIKTLAVLLREAGFSVTKVYRVGRIPMLAKSMVLVATKPME
jgi:2-polyprenyl-6-hydroxyphenyl methylase/3-demethylubiquinone-9 3-methyltransferase